MAKLKLQGKDLRRIGFPEDVSLGLAIQIMHKHFKHHTVDEALEVLKKILASPADYLDDPYLWKIADKLADEPEAEPDAFTLREAGCDFRIFGSGFIDDSAIAQMKIALRLPVAVSGALMPDAHHGYGLPIGGVLAGENAVIPFGVGVDIGCRMCLSIFDVPADELKNREKMLEKALLRNTIFGSGGQNRVAQDHEIIARPEFDEIPLIRNFRSKAAMQLGTSGSGNHFVEFGEIEITEGIPEKNLEPGRYIGLLSHSGSRGLGATIANHYTQVAMDMLRLPKEAQHMAWLPLDREEGQEYWAAMNLAGDYASACHHVIHERISREIQFARLAMIENHHNFAWKEMINGRELIVHRKGATPASLGELGIIPGSMTTAGFIVRGKGEAGSINSASHGAGRKMSRSKALQSITRHALKEAVKSKGVTLFGGGPDEAPQAYKDIHAVMQAQKQLVDTLGCFMPKIVRMDG
ncbi:MAG: hypothetical protein FD123_1125 [Bacteroidetes bacterium]|nr:MAG: hypothetical protein FD123_1125 [Bacteroidota bacterium]